LTISKEKLVDLIAKIEVISGEGGSNANETQTIESQIYLITQSLKDAGFLSLEALCKRISQAQDEILLLMTPLYERFLDSNNYRDYEVSMKDQERKNYTEKPLPRISLRVVTNNTTNHTTALSSAEKTNSFSSMELAIRSLPLFPACA
jgi:hypothetical protein